MIGEEFLPEIEKCVQNNVTWNNLPHRIKQILEHPDVYSNCILEYSLRNQIRYRGSLVRNIFKNEEHYYELIVEKSIQNLCLFPYHLADIITKGLRITPFNYYIEIIHNFLKNEKSYDTLPNFTAADCLRVLGIGRNEYLSFSSKLKSNSSKIFRKPNPKQILPKFPIQIAIEPWWKIEIGYVLENDIKYLSDAEKELIDYLIDNGSQIAGEYNRNVIHDLYRKGLIYLDVPIDDNDKISIPPLRNFVMNRLSGDYFENLLYKIFVSTDENMTIIELSKVLQINLTSVKQAVSLICRLGFAKNISEKIMNLDNYIILHETWKNHADNNNEIICPLNYNALLMHNQIHTNLQTDISPSVSKKYEIDLQQQNVQQQIDQMKSDTNSIEYISSDGNVSDFSFTGIPPTSSLNSFVQEHNNKVISANTNNNIIKINCENECNSEMKYIGMETVKLQSKTIQTTLTNPITTNKTIKYGKRIGFLFDSTLTAFLMMGNLSPGLKNHAVTMFEVGKLCEESMDTFLSELEKVSLLDAEDEGEVGRYFAHAIILRSTIIALRNAFENGLDLLRLECLESLDYKTRDRLLEKKYKFIISSSPLTGYLTHLFTIPFFGQFYKSSDTSHIWSKLFYYHISGYGPPSLFLSKGTILKSLPRLFLGYSKLLVTIVHTDAYVISSENYKNINEQLNNDCVLIQAYGVTQPGELKYESFPFDMNDKTKLKWIKHKAVQKLKKHLDLNTNCGYITFLYTGVPDLGCENYECDVKLSRSKVKRRKSLSTNINFNINDNQQQNSNDNLSLNVQNILSKDSMVSPTLVASTTDFSDKQINEICIESNTSMAMPVTSNNAQLNDQILTDHLKTPDESYFAMTPQNSPQLNVSLRDDYNQILETECDNLVYITNINDNEDNMKIENTITDNTKDIFQETSHEDEQKSKLINNENNKAIIQKINENEDKTNGEIWTILDVNFGVPLFDVDCNTRICEHIVNNLSSDENLEKLTASQKKMNEKLLNFVKQCMYFEDEYNEIVRLGKLPSQPRINLAFENGKICYWNGK